MQAFHNDPAIKEKYLKRVREHAAAGRLIQGTGWRNLCRCAVGCTLEAYDHSRYPIELGIPEWLARLEDSTFEGLPREDAMTWPERFLSAIPVGANLEPVRRRLAVLRLDRLIALQREAIGKHGIDETLGQVIAALEVVRRCHEAEANGTSCDVSFKNAESAAESAARSAESAAESAAWSAESAAWSARSAARSAWKTEAEDILRLLSEA